jgi:cysteinyl-tRNA synthetase
MLLTIKNLRKHLTNASIMKNFQPPFNPVDYQKKFNDMMDDDFNTPRAIAVLFDLTKDTNSYINSNPAMHAPFLEEVDQLFQNTAGEVLGLIPADLMSQKLRESQGEIEKVIQVVVDLRQKLRENKQFELADQLRDGLGKVGITLVDKPDGTGFEYRED